MPIIQSLIVGILALFGIVIAQSWTTRRDYTKRRIDLAEEVLALFYEAEDAIRMIRSPFGYSDIGSRPKREKETAEEAVALDRTYVIQDKYQKREAVFISLRAKKHRFMATFRGETKEPFEAIDKALNQIMSAYNILSVFYWPKLAEGKSGAPIFVSEHHREQFMKDMAKMEAILYGGDPNDEICQRIAEAIQRIEAVTDRAAKAYATGIQDWIQRYKEFVDNSTREDADLLG